MTNDQLALEYYRKCLIRLKALIVLHQEGGFADVVRESQEIVELLLKGLLRHIGMDPPKWHDVGPVLPEHKAKFSAKVQKNLNRIIKFSARLRRDRELSYYGAVDFIPSENYDEKVSRECVLEVKWLLKLLEGDLGGQNNENKKAKPKAQGNKKRKTSKNTTKRKKTKSSR